MTHPKLQSKKMDVLPANLGEAFIEMKNSQIAKNTLGKETYTKYLKAKTKEWDEYRMYVSPWEINQYLEIY